MTYDVIFAVRPYGSLGIAFDKAWRVTGVESAKAAQLLAAAMASADGYERMGYVTVTEVLS